MSVASGIVTVGVAATEVVAPALSSNRVNSVLVKNTGSVQVFVGGPDVTTGNGFPLDPGETLPIDVDENDVLYGVVASGNVNVAVLTMGNN